VLHEAFHIAGTGRPGPVVVDIPKDVQVASATWHDVGSVPSCRASYQYAFAAEERAIERAVEMMAQARRPIFYTGGGVINAGDGASTALREIAQLTGAPVTSTLMGLGAFPAISAQWLGMLGMHGTYEANMAMNEADLIVAVGARFDDRVTGRLDAFSPHSAKIHIDIDRSSIDKTVPVDLAINADAGEALAAIVARWRVAGQQPRDLATWWRRIEGWRARAIVWLLT
jgi:acetolactate synthase-1/2/3 large subunit